MNILLIDDERELCEEIASFIEKLGHLVTRCYDGKDGWEKARDTTFDLIISDVTIPHINGIDLSRKIREHDPSANIILISGIDDIIRTINAIDLGILDFLTKPVKVEKIAEILKLVEEKLTLDRTIDKKQAEMREERKTVNIEQYIFKQNFSFYHANMGVIGIFSDKLASIFNKLHKLQEYPDIPVLIEGETGTGKEIIAKYIHYENPLNEGQFIGINCSTFPRELFESELFGYEKGSFTGADTKGREGKIKLAENGTLFLDEITEIPLDLQAKLLRVLQEREFYRVGGNTKYSVNTRICCATNRDIRTLVEKGLFREDLYYRLNVCQVNIPPLRERMEEVIPLTVFFIREFNGQMKKNIESVEWAALEALADYDWPGNVRELKNMVNKVMLFSEGKRLHEKEFLPFLKKSENRKKGTAVPNFDPQHIRIPDEPFDLNRMVDQIVRETLKKFKGNKTKTAEFLGLTRIQMYRRFK